MINEMRLADRFDAAPDTDEIRHKMMIQF